MGSSAPAWPCPRRAACLLGGQLQRRGPAAAAGGAVRPWRRAEGLAGCQPGVSAAPSSRSGWSGAAGQALWAGGARGQPPRGGGSPPPGKWGLAGDKRRSGNSGGRSLRGPSGTSSVRRSLPQKRPPLEQGEVSGLTLRACRCQGVFPCLRRTVLGQQRSLDLPTKLAGSRATRRRPSVYPGRTPLKRCCASRGEALLAAGLLEASRRLAPSVAKLEGEADALVLAPAGCGGQALVEHRVHVESVAGQ